MPVEARSRVMDRRVLLVDDVLTTGSTANAASRALLRGGAASVDVLALPESLGTVIPGQEFLYLVTERGALIGPITITPELVSLCLAMTPPQRKGLAFTEIDIEAQAGARQGMIQKAGGRTSVPPSSSGTAMSAGGTTFMPSRRGPARQSLARLSRTDQTRQPAARPAMTSTRFTAACVMRSGRDPVRTVTSRSVSCARPPTRGHARQTPEMTSLVERDRAALFEKIGPEERDPSAGSLCVARDRGIVVQVGSIPVLVGDKVANRAFVIGAGDSGLLRQDPPLGVDLPSGEDGASPPPTRRRRRAVLAEALGGA